MDYLSGNFAAIAVFLASAGWLAWGYNRARPYGKSGILAWLQSATLILPWVVFFGLFASGIYLNLAGILLLFVLSTGAYILLGNRLRSLVDGQNGRSRPSGFPPEISKSEVSESNNPSSESAQPTSNDPALVKTSPPASPPFGGAPLSPEALKTIQSIFSIDTFFSTDSTAYQDGAIFKGNLRGDPEVTHQRLSDRLYQLVGDRYRLFLVFDPADKPVVIVLPSSSDPQPITTSQTLLAGVLLLATLATTLETCGVFLGFDLFSNLDRFRETLPLGLGIWTVLLAHEVAHQWIARLWRVRFSLPFFLPTWQIGSFGAINRFESLLPNRLALFDIAFAGPAAGGLASLGMLIAGLLLSHDGSFFQLPSVFFRESLLVGGLTKLFLGSKLVQSLVDIHPLVIVGWLGLVFTALNLMPAGQLDGGRIVQAVYGRKIAGRTTLATIAVLAIATFANPIALYWAAVIVFLQRNLERPSLNEIVEPNDTRAVLCLVALFLAIATLLPITPGIATRLGIGAF